MQGKIKKIRTSCIPENLSILRSKQYEEHIETPIFFQINSYNSKYLEKKVF